MTMTDTDTSTDKDAAALEDFLKKARDRFSMSLEYDREDRDIGKGDIKFGLDFEGEQWPAELRRQREEGSSPRPCLTINKIPEKLDISEGEFRQSEPGINVIPVDNYADPVGARVRGGLIKNIMYNSDARPVLTNAYSSLLYSGRCAWQVNVQDNHNDWFVKDLVLETIKDPFSVYYDPASVRLDNRDAKWCHVVTMLSKDEVEEKYGEDINFSDWPTEDKNLSSWVHNNLMQVSVYYWIEVEKKTVYQVERAFKGVKMLMAVEKLENEEVAIQEKEVDFNIVKFCTMAGDRILTPKGENEIRTWPGQYIPVILVKGKTNFIDGKQVSRSAIKYSKDSARQYNYWASVATEQVALAPKAPYLVTDRQLGPYQNIWDKAATENYMYLPFVPDARVAGGKPSREFPHQMSTAISGELARAEHDIAGALGRHTASTGEVGPERSGKAIRERKMQGSLGAFTYMDNMREGMELTGQILGDLLPAVYDTERIVRILGPDNKEIQVVINTGQDSGLRQAQGVDQTVVSIGADGLLNSLAAGKYDYRVSIGAGHATQRQEMFEFASELFQTMPSKAGMFLDLIFKNADKPGAAEMAERAKKMIPVNIRGLDPGEEPPPDPPPDPKVVLAEQTLGLKAMQQEHNAELELMEENRKKFETVSKLALDHLKTETKAILDLARAESLEAGIQLPAYMNATNKIKGDNQNGKQPINQSDSD